MAYIVLSIQDILDSVSQLLTLVPKVLHHMGINLETMTIHLFLLQNPLDSFQPLL